MLWGNNLCTFLDVLTITMNQSWICECIYEACYTEWFLKCAMKNETWNGFAIPEKQTEPGDPHLKVLKWNTLKLPALGKPPDCLFNYNPANVIGRVRIIMLEFFYCLNNEQISFLFWKTLHWITSITLEGVLLRVVISAGTVVLVRSKRGLGFIIVSGKRDLVLPLNMQSLTRLELVEIILI